MTNKLYSADMCLSRSHAIRTEQLYNLTWDRQTTILRIQTKKNRFLSLRILRKYLWFSQNFRIFFQNLITIMFKMFFPRKHIPQIQKKWTPPMNSNREKIWQPVRNDERRARIEFFLSFQSIVLVSHFLQHLLVSNEGNSFWFQLFFSNYLYTFFALSFSLQFFLYRKRRVLTFVKPNWHLEIHFAKNQ